MTPPISRLEKSFKAVLERANYQKKTAIVACSGGGDSVALAHLAAKYHQGGLALAYVQHGLRGSESLEDEAFVRALALCLAQRHSKNVGFHILDGRMTKFAGQGLESAARAIRREKLFQFARLTGAEIVLMGHNLNDQVETFFMRLARGAGPLALGGIRGKVFPADGIALLRPLLSHTRQELRDYLRNETLPWREDSSNDCSRITRNHVRMNVIVPLVERFGKKFLGRVLAHMRRVARYAERDRTEIAQTLDGMEMPRAGMKVVLDRSKMPTLSEKGLADVFHYVWFREKWPGRDLTRRHLRKLAKSVLGGAPLGNLPGGISFRMDKHVVCLGPDFPDPNP